MCSPKLTQQQLYLKHWDLRRKTLIQVGDTHRLETVEISRRWKRYIEGASGWGWRAFLGCMLAIAL